MAKGNRIYATISLKDDFTKIAGKVKEATQELKNKVAGATEEWKKHSTEAGKAGGTLGSTVKKIVGAAAAYASFGAAKDFLTDCATGVMELERANERLSTLMLNTKGNTQAMADDIIAYGDALELVTTIEGDATVAGASQLATFQLQGDTIKSLLPSLQNLAVAQNGVDVSQDNMIQSANLLGKVMMGQTGALSKAGVSFSEEQKKILQTGTEAEKTAALIQVLDQNFGGLAESMAQTDEGKIISLRNAWGSVKDEVGFMVMPAVSKFVGYVHEHIPQIRDTVTNACDKVKNTIDTVSGAIGFMKDNWNWIGPIVYGVVAAFTAYNAVTGITTGLQSLCALTTGLTSKAITGMTATELIATSATAALGTAVSFLTSPLFLITLAIGAVIAIGVLLWKNWDTIKEKAAALGANFVTIFGNIKEFCAGVWEGIKDGLKGAVNFVIKGINILIRGLNKLQFDVPEGVPVIGGLKFGFNISEVPMLASGGIIMRSGMTLVGERGPELLNLPRGASVIPLPRDTGTRKTTTNTNTFYINIYTNELDDASIDNFVARVKFAMANM